MKIKTINLILLLMIVAFAASRCTLKGRDITSAADKTSQSKPATIDASEYSSLQDAFDAVPEAGGEVIIPPGDYELTEPLILTRENTHVRGAGASTHIINRNESGEPAIIVRPKDISDKKAYVWRVQLSDFSVSGNKKSGDGLVLERLDELYISGISVDHHGANGIKMINCYENPRINQSSFTYNAQAGLYMTACHDVVVSANEFEENQDALQYIDGFNLTMSGNNIDDHLRHGIVIENTYGSVVSGNMIEECKGTALILDRDCYGITLSSNVIAHNGGGVELRDAWGCTLSANTFVLVFNFSVLIGPNSGRNAITGNNFCNSYVGEDKLIRKELDEGHGIVLQGTSDIAISGNVFGGLSGEAIKADQACSRILVTGNIMTDLGRHAEGARTAMDLSRVKESIVKDNSIAKGLVVK